MKREWLGQNWNFQRGDQQPVAVNLPHDAMLSEERKADAPCGTGGAFFAGNRYVYTKVIRPDDSWRDKTVMLEFEGVYPSAEVYLNGIQIGGCSYGYSLFTVELDDLIYGRENEIKVVADNSRLPNSRWYSGAGIYRPVWLLTGPKKAHILPGGLLITTKSLEPATMVIDVDYVGQADAVKVSIWENSKDPMTKEIPIDRMAAGNATGILSTEVTIPDAKLWSADNPCMYACRAELIKDGKILDSEETSFGIRQISYSAEGFFINGKRTLLQGGCIHHDNGILGAASYAESEWRRIRILKENGYNAVRSAHNPLCRAALEACDVLGMYVMDEAWDMWYRNKNPYDYANDFEANYEADLKSLAAKDYNHPSVILYSIGNEVTEPAEEKGVETAKKLVDKLHELDATRPVTAGINLTLLLMEKMKAMGNLNRSEESGQEAPAAGAAPQTDHMTSTDFNKMVFEMGQRMTLAAASEPADRLASPVLDLLDIAGYNYATLRYESDRKLHPNRLIVGSETYPQEIAKNWNLVRNNPNVIGDFMWTAWDYLGEAGIGCWSYDEEDRGFNKTYPYLLSDAGAIDILGDDNAEAGLAAVVWGARKTPYIGVRPVNHPKVVPNAAMWRGTNARPNWSYEGCDGNEAYVEIYADAAEVELLVNGRSLGRKKLTECSAVYETVYESGQIEAVSYDADGRKIGWSQLLSATGNRDVRIRAEQTMLCGESEISKAAHTNGFISELAAAGEGDILYVDIDICGENGILECNCDRKLQITVEGGKLLGYGSARPKTEESYLAGQITTYYGRSQAIIRRQASECRISVYDAENGMLLQTAGC